MPKKTAPKEDELAWIFDSLVDFLCGPLWNIPVMNFIEEKSMLFEPDGDNARTYQKIYNNYKNLVDVMLTNYMEDLCITPLQFEKACNKSADKMKFKFSQLQFEQLWAADDFDMFVRMMIRTNIQLQLQALELLQQRHGIIPASFLPGEDICEQERRILEEVTRRSLEDQKGDSAQLDGETRALEEAIVSTTHTKQHLQAGRDREQEIINSTMNLTLSDSPPAAPQAPADKVPPEELKRRQEYLRQQRDKLLLMKRAERERMLAAESESKEARPKSSRAARSAMAGKIDPKTMEMRKALAQALRREVVDKK